MLSVDHLGSDDESKRADSASPMMTRSKAKAKSKASKSKLAEETTQAPPKGAKSPKPKAAKTTSAAPATQSTQSSTLRARSVPQPATQAPPKHAPATPAAPNTFWKKVRERVVFSLLMIAGFTFILAMGPAYMILLILVLETLVYREVTALFNVPGRTLLSAQSQTDAEDEDDSVTQRETDREELWNKTMSWYFFAVCNFFLYGESLVYYFKHVVMIDSFYLHFAPHHRFISFMLYIFGFMAFVSNLKRKNLKHQFALFCWVHMSLMLIVLSSHFLVDNILEGIIWFWVPASLVICNDIFAYVCGMLFGRTPLISLSPKKTVEGFVGALLITLVFAWFWAGFFQRFDYMVCPAISLGMSVFNPPLCKINPVFATHSTALPEGLAQVLTNLVGRPVTSISWTPFQWHAVVMAAFASLVAPFGGFFASGFKRAFKIKDFGDSIPGHGGLTDRFDCQFIMGLFSYVYYSSLIRDPRISVQMVMQLIVTQLPVVEQKQLLANLSTYLTDHGA